MTSLLERCARRMNSPTHRLAACHPFRFLHIEETPYTTYVLQLMLLQTRLCIQCSGSCQAVMRLCLARIPPRTLSSPRNSQHHSLNQRDPLIIRHSTQSLSHVSSFQHQFYCALPETVTLTITDSICTRLSGVLPFAGPRSYLHRSTAQAALQQTHLADPGPLLTPIAGSQRSPRHETTHL